VLGLPTGHGSHALLRAVVLGLRPQSLSTPPGSNLDLDVETVHFLVQTRIKLSQNKSAEQSRSSEQQSPASRKPFPL
jgi:hypothetical protein